MHKIFSMRTIHGIITVINFPIVLMVYAIQPFVKLRFGYFSANRIGHFALDLGYEIAQNKNKNKNEINLYYLQGDVSNSQLAIIAKRELNVSQYYRYFVYAYMALGLDKNILLPNRYKSESVGSRDITGTTYYSQYNISLLDQENVISESYMKKHGWTHGEKFICINVRDNAFFDELEVSRHSYRNTDIDTYEEAVNYLLSLGYWIVRMGKKVGKPFKIKHSRLIDYGSDPNRSDLLDIWFCKNCYFFISTGTGVDSVAIMFKKQIVFVNHLPLVHIHSWVDSITVPKRLFWDNGKELSLKEHLDNAYVDTRQYKKNKINIIDLSPDEIKSVVQEMVMRLNGSILTIKQNQEQKLFWEILEHHDSYGIHHNVRNPNALFGISFLKRNPDFLS